MTCLCSGQIKALDHQVKPRGFLKSTRFFFLNICLYLNYENKIHLNFNPNYFCYDYFNGNCNFIMHQGK